MGDGVNHYPFTPSLPTPQLRFILHPSAFILSPSGIFSVALSVGLPLRQAQERLRLDVIQHRARMGSTSSPQGVGKRYPRQFGLSSPLSELKGAVVSAAAMHIIILDCRNKV